MKTQLTKEIEQALLRSCFAPNNKSLAKYFGAFEVTMGFSNQKLMMNSTNSSGIEVVDFLTYERNTDTFRCYEIKVSVSDLKSKCAKSFYGDYNYLVVPVSLIEEMGDSIKNYIPACAGIIAYDSESGMLKEHKRVKKMTVSSENKEILKASLIRSLFYKAYKKPYYNKERR